MVFAAGQELLDSMEAEDTRRTPDDDIDEEGMLDAGPKAPARRAVYERPDNDDTAWGEMLADTDALLQPESRAAQKFNNRFRIPYPAFVELMKVVEGQTGKEPWFTSGSKDASGRRCVPPRLKVSHEMWSCLSCGEQ